MKFYIIGGKLYNETLAIGLPSMDGFVYALAYHARGGVPIDIEWVDMYPEDSVIESYEEAPFAAFIVYYMNQGDEVPPKGVRLILSLAIRSLAKTEFGITIGEVVAIP